VRVDAADAAHHLFERHVDHAAVPPGDHAIEAALPDQLDRMDAKGRAEQPVARVGRTAALNMAKDRDARLRARGVGDHRGDIMPDPAISSAPRGVGLQDRRTILARDRLGDHDESEIATRAAHRLDVAHHRRQPPGDLRDEDHVGTAGDARGDRDMTGVPAHDLQHHDAAMARRRGLQTVERLCGGLHRGRRA